MVRVVSEFQSTSIDHAEVLRRLEQELLAFKLDTETKLTEEASYTNPDPDSHPHPHQHPHPHPNTETKLSGVMSSPFTCGCSLCRTRLQAGKLSGVIVDQRKIGESVDLAAADSTLGRLKEVELALLKEREMRKALEHEVVAMQALTPILIPTPNPNSNHDPNPNPSPHQVVAMRGERGATQAMVEEAVHASMRAHGGETLTPTPPSPACDPHTSPLRPYAPSPRLYAPPQAAPRRSRRRSRSAAA